MNKSRKWLQLRQITPQHFSIKIQNKSNISVLQKDIHFKNTAQNCGTNELPTRTKELILIVQ